MKEENERGERSAWYPGNLSLGELDEENAERPDVA
jgi:hypothetical protein